MQVVDRLIDEGITKTTDSNGILYYEWHDKCYLGAAHGISGITYILLKVSAFPYQKKTRNISIL